MRIEAENSFIDFQFVESEGSGYASISISVGLTSRGFSGQIDHVWFSLKDAEEFLAQLEVLNHSGQGEARLRCMSDQSLYAPLRFRIFSTDVRGRLAIEAEIMKAAYLGYQTRRVANKVSVNFEIDPSLLPVILSNFRALFAPRET